MKLETNKIKITHEGELNLAGTIIPCYMLENGTRVLSGRGMQASLKMVDKHERQQGGARLYRYLKQKTLKPFIIKEIGVGHIKPIICYKGNKKVHGYEARILTKICKVFLKARRNIKLSSRQQIIAAQAEILIEAFSDAGITALVDEATGYEKEKTNKELEFIANACISENILKWQLEFSNEFYKELYRLWEIPFTEKYLKNKPSFIGILTNKYIYKQLPDGVLERIKTNTPKTKRGHYKYKFHQSLTDKIGKKYLRKQIYQITALMAASKDKIEFLKLFEQKSSTSIQLQIF